MSLTLHWLGIWQCWKQPCLLATYCFDGDQLGTGVKVPYVLCAAEKHLPNHHHIWAKFYTKVHDADETVLNRYPERCFLSTNQSTA